MVTHIRIRNFKAFLDTSWIELKKLNYLMGANGAGKSSLSKALAFMKHSLLQPSDYGMFPSRFTMNVPDGDLGTFGETLYDNSKEDNFSISYKIALDEKFNKSKKWMENQFVIDFQFKGEDYSTECHISKINVSTFSSDKDIITVQNLENKTTTDLTTMIMVNQKNFHENGFNLETLEQYMIETGYKKDVMAIIKNRIWEKTLKESLSTISNYVSPEIKFDSDDFLGNENPYFSAGFWLTELFKNANANIKYLNYKIHDRSLRKITDAVLNELSEEDELSRTFLKLRHIPRHRDLHPFSNPYLGEQRFNPQEENEEKFEVENKYLNYFEPSIFIGDLLMQITDVINQFHSSIIHIHPDRASNDRLIKRQRNENDIWNRLNRDKLQKDKIKYVINNLNDDNINDIHFKSAPIDKFFSIEIKQKDGKQRNIMDIGFGYSQLLPVLFSCLEVHDRYQNSPRSRKISPRVYRRISRGSLIIIEEPEVHTHPRLAAMLAEFFMKFLNDYDDCRFLIETHSEHLILKTQGLIKESPDYSKSNQILFLEKTYDEKNQSNSTIQKIDFNEDGHMSKPFPDDFFDISYNLYERILD